MLKVAKNRRTVSPTELTPAAKIALFREVFRGRRDVYAVAWESEGRRGYRPVRQTFTNAVVEAHLKGRQVVGVYPLLRDNTTWFLAIDYDGPQAAGEARMLAHQCRRRELPVYLERSRSGAGFHLWFFFEEPVQGAEARAFGKRLLEASGTKLRSFDRFFPSQSHHVGEKGLGNLIALPLQGRSRLESKTVFVDPRSLEPIEDQWAHLAGVRRVTRDELDLVLSEPDDVLFAPLPLTVPDQGQDDVEPLFGGTVDIVLREHLEVKLPCPPSLAAFLRSESVFLNPVWFDKHRQGRYTGDTPKFLRCGGRVGERWILSRGLWPKLKKELSRPGVRFQVDDQRCRPTELQGWTRQFQLRPDQLELVQRLLPLEEAVLEAPTGTGKTMLGLELVARRAVPALILVPSRALLDQWVDRIEKGLGIKRRQVGLVRSGTLTLGERVTVATLQSLLRRDLGQLVEHVGHVVIDECHHVPARTFAAIVRQLRPLYLLGLTATPRRRDQLHKLIFCYLGEKVKGPTPIELARRGLITLPRLEVRRTRFRHTSTERIQDLLADVTRDPTRTGQIASDVLEATGHGHLALILSDRKEHCDRLSQALEGKVGVATLYGAVGKKARRRVFDEFSRGVVPVLVATARLLGEGWDCPPLSALFLALPMGASPRLEQLLGRLTRPHEDKLPPVVYDYLDHQVEQLAAMFARRVKVYRRFLGDERLPAEFQSDPTRSRRATIRYGPRPTPRKPSVVAEPDGQLWLFE